MRKLFRRIGLVFFASVMVMIGLALTGLWAAVVWGGYRTVEGISWIYFIILPLMTYHPHVRLMYRTLWGCARMAWED